MGTQPIFAVIRFIPPEALLFYRGWNKNLVALGDFGKKENNGLPLCFPPKKE
jgi:hypothetical protein